MKKIVIPCFLGFCLALATRAQGVFQATLSTPSDGSGAQLMLGNFWFQVVNGEVDFIARVDSFGSLTPNLKSAVLSVSGSSIGFSPGATLTGFIGSQTDPNWNPFLPPVPPTPAGYDDDGNPYYLSYSPPPIPSFYYTGHFSMPPGFLDELLAGNGKIEFNDSSVVGNISAAAVPEPTAVALGLLAVGGLLLVRWHKRAVGQAFNYTRSQQPTIFY